MLSVPEYNKRLVREKMAEVKTILRPLRFPFSHRVAGQQGNFRTKDWQEWLEKADREQLAKALTRLAQLNQTKIYLFWKNPHSPFKID